MFRLERRLCQDKLITHAKNFSIHFFIYIRSDFNSETDTLCFWSSSFKLDKPVILRVAKTYKSHIELVGKNKVDIAYMGPAPYVKLVKNYGHKPLLAKIQVLGKSTFRGAIIVAQNSPIKTLADLLIINL